MEELPWRIIQGAFGLFIFILFLLFFRLEIPIVHGPLEILLSVAIVLLALGVSYTFKMILALTSFWTTDFWGVLSMEEVTFLVFGGIVMPLTFYPEILEKISYVLPLAYIVYFPVVAIQGKLSVLEMIQTIVIQFLWIAVLYQGYKVFWSKGIKKFTAIGQ